MRLLLTCSAVAATLVGGMVLRAPTLRAQPTNSCWMPPDSGRMIVNHIKQVATAPSGPNVAVREAYRLLPVSEADIWIVTDSAVCAAAAAANHALIPAGERDTVYPVFVLRVGPQRYIVFDEESRVGQRESYVVMDETFAILGGIAG